MPIACLSATPRQIDQIASLDLVPYLSPPSLFYERTRTSIAVSSNHCIVSGNQANRSRYADAFTIMGRNLRNRRALLTTVTEDSAIAAPARTGLSSTLNNGYRTPAATGIRTTL